MGKKGYLKSTTIIPEAYNRVACKRFWKEMCSRANTDMGLTQKDLVELTGIDRYKFYAITAPAKNTIPKEEDVRKLAQITPYTPEVIMTAFGYADYINMDRDLGTNAKNDVRVIRNTYVNPVKEELQRKEEEGVVHATRKTYAKPAEEPVVEENPEPTFMEVAKEVQPLPEIVAPVVESSIALEVEKRIKEKVFMESVNVVENKDHSITADFNFGSGLKYSATITVEDIADAFVEACKKYYKDMYNSMYKATFCREDIDDE